MKEIVHTQDHDLSHSMVHYLLTIHKLKEEKGYARVTDIAKDLGLTKGSVSTAINNLKRKEFVMEEEDSKFLSLTDRGHDEVHHILSSRTQLYYFLRDFLGVGEELARKDSCLMEHLLSHETREYFFRFMKKVACGCESVNKEVKEYLDLKSSLDLCRFENAKDFFHEQKGDSFLNDPHPEHK